LRGPRWLGREASGRRIPSALWLFALLAAALVAVSGAIDLGQIPVIERMITAQLAHILHELRMSMAPLVVLLMVVGIVLLAIELLIIPGFGFVGLLGCASILGAAGVAWVFLSPEFGLLAVGGGVGSAALLLWVFPKTGTGRAMVLHETQRSGRGPDRQLAALVGKVGRALTPLRPAGTAEIADRTIDVVTDGVYVNAGDPVRVAKVEGTRVVVEPREG
jgi:membrane-bound ClpP family serine protease